MQHPLLVLFIRLFITYIFLVHIQNIHQTPTVFHRFTYCCLRITSVFIFFRFLIACLPVSLLYPHAFYCFSRLLLLLRSIFRHSCIFHSSFFLCEGRDTHHTVFTPQHYTREEKHNTPNITPGKRNTTTLKHYAHQEKQQLTLRNITTRKKKTTLKNYTQQKEKKLS